jgi:hypothetical protein
MFSAVILFHTEVPEVCCLLYLIIQHRGGVFRSSGCSSSEDILNARDWGVDLNLPRWCSEPSCLSSAVNQPKLRTPTAPGWWRALSNLLLRWKPWGLEACPERILPVWGQFLTSFSTVRLSRRRRPADQGIEIKLLKSSYTDFTTENPESSVLGRHCPQSTLAHRNPVLVDR